MRLKEKNALGGGGRWLDRCPSEAAIAVSACLSQVRFGIVLNADPGFKTSLEESMGDVIMCMTLAHKLHQIKCSCRGISSSLSFLVTHTHPCCTCQQICWLRIWFSVFC